MAENIVTSDVQFASNGDQATGYLARPEGGGPHPGIIVVQEWWGVDAHIKDVTERFAREGFVALAPDLFHGEVATEQSEAQRLAMGMDRDRALQDLAGGATYLSQQSFVADGKIASIGYCMGGGLSLHIATLSPLIRAAIVYYGGNPPDIDAVANLQGPVLGIYGGTDERVNAGIPALEEAMRRHGKSFEHHIYPGAAHGFFNDTQPRHDSEASRDAWSRTLAFLQQNLG